jgi:hypothetical protein
VPCSTGDLSSGVQLVWIGKGLGLWFVWKWRRSHTTYETTVIVLLLK